MSSKEQFAALEAMCRERAAIAKKEWKLVGRSSGMEATQVIF